MNKIELISEILNLYDEKQRLNEENQRLNDKFTLQKNRENQFEEQNEEYLTFAKESKEFQDETKDFLFSKIFYTYDNFRSHPVLTKENTIITFNDWLNSFEVNNINEKKYLETHSLGFFKEYFLEQLHRTYLELIKEVDKEEE